MQIRIRTLGGLEVLADGQARSQLNEQPVRAALLVYLAMEREVTREAAQGILWAHLPPDGARHSLNQTVYLLRKELGEGWLKTEGERLTVARDVTVDALEFEERVRDAATGDALDLYRGDFLHGWHLGNTPEFEQWTDRVRFRMARLHREACRARLQHLDVAGPIGEALLLAREWVDRDPLEDEAQHALIELLARAGHRGEALEQYERYLGLLAAEGLRPLDDTQSLAEALRTGAGIPGRETHQPEPDGDSTDAPLPADRGPPSVPSSARAGLARWILVLAVGLLVVPSGVHLYRRMSEDRGGPELDPGRVLVFPLENRTAEPSLDPAGRLAADWIAQGLTTVDFLEVVPSGELLSGLTRPEAGTVPSSHLARARTAAVETGAGTLVTGAYYLNGPEVEFHAQILEAPEWSILEAVGPIRTATYDPVEAIDVLRQRVLIRLVLHRDESLGGIFTQSEFPPSYEAYQAYLEGVRSFGQGDFQEAAEHLLHANEVSPDFLAPLVYAGFALINGDRDYPAADSVARVMEADQDGLPRYDRLRLELLRATLDGDHLRAYRAVKEAAALLPGGPAQYGAAQKALQLNRPMEALAMLRDWDPTRPAARSWTPYWDVLTQSHHLLGEHRRELREARRGRRLAPDRIETAWFEARALAALGRTRDLEVILEASSGYRWTRDLNPGAMTVRAAEELQAHGHLDGMRAVLSRFRPWYDGLDPEVRSRPELRALHGRACYLAGQLEDAEAAFSRLHRDHPDDPEPMRFLGVIAARRGDHARAERWSGALRDLDGAYLFGRPTLGRAAIAARLGDSRAALALVRRSVVEGVPFGTGLHSDPDLRTLADHPSFQRFIRPVG